MKRWTRLLRYAAVALSAAAATAAVSVLIHYRRELQVAYRRLHSRKRRYVGTPCGLIEVAIRGEGYPVLVLHGSAGGFDRGLDMAAQHLGTGYQAIAPSRFGYLGTPLPLDATPAAQADAYACLLDALDLDTAAVIAYSAGGPSALQFALRYPDCVSALVLVSTGVAGRTTALPSQTVISATLRSNFLLWLLTHWTRQTGIAAWFVPADYPLTPDEAAELDTFLHHLLPIRPRRSGTSLDLLQTNLDPVRHPEAYPLEDVGVPTLIINARDDPLVSYEKARAMGQRIPDARFVTIPAGGHIMVGHGGFIRAEIDAFLQEHAQ